LVDKCREEDIDVGGAQFGGRGGDECGEVVKVGTPAGRAIWGLTQGRKA
jgi:hypothetical protein